VVVGRRRRRTPLPRPPPPSIAPITSRHVSCPRESTRRFGVSSSCLSLSVPCLAFCALCRLSRLRRSSWVSPPALLCSTRPIPLLLSVCDSCIRLQVSSQTVSVSPVLCPPLKAPLTKRGDHASRSEASPCNPLASLMIPFEISRQGVPSQARPAQEPSTPQRATRENQAAIHPPLKSTVN
jgi:hypothetical protein